MIDLDQDPSPAAGSWLPMWLRSVAVAAAVGATIALVAAAAGWIAGSRGTQAAPQEHTIVLDATGPAAAAVYYRDGSAEGLVELGEPLYLSDVAGAVVSVSSTGGGQVSCEITVDGRMLDRAQGSGGGSALCVWIADAHTGIWVPAADSR